MVLKKQIYPCNRGAKQPGRVTPSMHTYYQWPKSGMLTVGGLTSEI